MLSFDLMGESVSIRMDIWLILLVVWSKMALLSFREKDASRRSVFLKKEILSRGYLKNFLLLFIFIAWGGINGFWRNAFNDAFLDFNAWMYFALIFPLYEAIFNKNLYPSDDDGPFWPIWRICAVGISWLAIKTYAFLFIFSHLPSDGRPLHDFLAHQMYYWIRSTGVGEITNMPSGFVRVFLQSHFFLLPALYVLLLMSGRYWGEIYKNKKMMAFVIASISIVSSLVTISFSRSFWVGTIAALPLFAYISLKKFDPKRLAISCAFLLIGTIFGLAMIAGTVKFPYPKASADFDLTEALSDRAKKTSNETAAASRYALLPELWKVVSDNAILGAGFGKTVSYRTQDPRALENNPDGLYTTYAFEWGWLDIWLKIGALGLFSYFFLLWLIFKDALDKETFLSDAFAITLVIIFFTNIFTPYANHPLGIGLLLVLAAAASWEKKPCPCA